MVFAFLQLIRYARCCTYYDDFGYPDKLLVAILFLQSYKVNWLRNSFQRYPNLAERYQKSVRDMMNDSFPF